MARAIEVFEATLLTPDSPFDRYLKGDREALTAREEEGLKLFMDKFCASCHGGVNMGGQGYYPFGVVNQPTEGVRPAGDKGRYVVTNTWSDEYVFKSPSLRNIALTPPYFHSGKVWDLKEAVSIMGAVQLGVKYTEEDVDKIVTFLKSTTGVQPKVEYPIFPAPTLNTPKPRLD
jgi:cytochrome c peroxidase